MLSILKTLTRDPSVPARIRSMKLQSGPCKWTEFGFVCSDIQPSTNGDHIQILNLKISFEKLQNNWITNKQHILEIPGAPSKRRMRQGVDSSKNFKCAATSQQKSIHLLATRGPNKCCAYGVQIRK
eukprot:s401_g18.t1